MWKSTLNRSGVLSKYCSSISTFKMKSLIVLLLFSVSITLFADTWGDYEYTDNGNDITITGYTGDGGDITIPSEINGKSVVEIGYRAFYECDNLTSVMIPDSVTTIEGSAFAGCNSLTSITISDNITSIGDYALAACTSMTSITVDTANSNYSSLNGVLFDKDQTTLIQYPAGKSEASYTVPTGVTSIENYAFASCVNLEAITIGNSVTTIGSYMFYDSSLISVTIGSSLTTIADCAFLYCPSLTSITVDTANSNYSSLNGVLFNKDQTTLIQYPIGKSETFYTIPDSVTRIEDYGFYFCTSLTSITIGNSVTSIGDSVFYCCESLTTAIFSGDAPSSFGGGVFDNCASGFKVYYYADATGFSSPTWNGYPCEELPGCHSADTDSNWSISQAEVNSFIANYANNDNTVSTANGDITPGRITMREVLRVIYLYNNGGAYKISVGTIDKYDIAEVEESVEALPPTTTSSETNHTLVCTNSADSGAGSLRDAVANARYGDTITFDESLEKITLASEIVIDKSITIDGNGVTIVSGSGKTRIFRIYNENEDLFVTLLNMGIVDANNSADEFGGAIYNNGESLTLENCLLDRNKNSVENGKGGAIYSSGSLTVNNCELTDNFASEEDDIYSTDD